MHPFLRPQNILIDDTMPNEYVFEAHQGENDEDEKKRMRREEIEIKKQTTSKINKLEKKIKTIQDEKTIEKLQKEIDTMKLFSDDKNKDQYKHAHISINLFEN